jgi:hypothetical protein
MDKELGSLELQIQEKAKQLLEGLQALAHLSNELNIPELVLALEFLSLMLPGDSKLISSTQGTTKLYDELIACRELFHTKLTEINLAAKVKP